MLEEETQQQIGDVEIADPWDLFPWTLPTYKQTNWKSKSVSLEHGNCNGVGGSSLNLVWVVVCISLPDVNGRKVFPGTESVS
jgi:hypothetical protein